MEHCKQEDVIKDHAKKIDKHEEIVNKFDRLIAVMEVRNEYEEKRQTKLDELISTIVTSNADHEKRLSTVEPLIPQVKDLLESRIIRTDRWFTSKLQSGLFYGMMVIIIGTMISFMLFLPKIIQLTEQIKK
jgi:hypothetical protein